MRNTTQELEEKDKGKLRSKSHWRLFGAVGLLLAATAILANLNDIRRYIRISTM